MDDPYWDPYWATELRGDQIDYANSLPANTTSGFVRATELEWSGLENPNAENMRLDSCLLMWCAASLGHFSTGRRDMLTCSVVGLGAQVSRCTACGEVGFPTLGIVDAEVDLGVICGNDTEVNGHLECDDFNVMR
jgi:hypothetical protein